jgi:hypothetical protein
MSPGGPVRQPNAKVDYFPKTETRNLTIERTWVSEAFINHVEFKNNPQSFPSHHLLGRNFCRCNGNKVTVT